MDSDRNFTGAKGIETQMGRRMAIRRQHYNFRTIIPTAFETNNKALRNPRVISMICMNDKGGGFPVSVSGSPSGDTSVVSGVSGMDRITNGEFDSSYLIPCANGVAALGDPVFINLWYEPNGQHNNYYPGWQGVISTTLGTPGTGEIKYVNAYRHVVNVFRSHGASNAIFVWCHQGPSTDGWYQNLYPGDSFVDIIGVDLYRATFASRCTNPSTYNGGVHSQDYYLFAQGTALTGGQATSLQRASGVIKPFMICEAGYREGQTMPDVSGAGGDGLTYDKDGGEPGSHSAISKLLVDLKAHENCIGYVHWNELGDPNLSGTGNYVDTTSQALGQYQNFYNDPYCQVFFTGGAPVTLPPTTGSPTISDTTPQKNQVLVADTNPTSWDGTTPLTFTLPQWYWEDTVDGGGNPVLQPISGATAMTYTVVTADVGHRLKFGITATNAAGSVRIYTPLTAAVLNSGSTVLSSVPVTGTPGFYSSAWTTTNNHAGRVQRMVTKNGVTYVVGEFDHVVDNSGASPVDRTNTPYFCAYRKDTGAVIQTWIPNPNDYVHDIKLNAAGTKLIVVGKFTSIGGGTRHRVAMVSVLSGPTDTTSFALNSEMPDLGTGTAQDAELWRVLLDETNNRGWLCGAQSQKITRITKSAGTWAISGSWSPPSFTQGSGTAGPFLRCIALVGSNVVVGGQNISPSLVKLNGDTGASVGIS
ncbi:MAG TPA: glycosyl hydrolase, partial [Nitrospiraceae bacterium]